VTIIRDRYQMPKRIFFRLGFIVSNVILCAYVVCVILGDPQILFMVQERDKFLCGIFAVTLSISTWLTECLKERLSLKKGELIKSQRINLCLVKKP